MAEETPILSPWKNPQVIVSIIGGIVTIVVAIVGILPTIVNQNAAPVQATFTPTVMPFATYTVTDAAVAVLVTEAPTTTNTPEPAVQPTTIPPTDIPMATDVPTPVPQLPLMPTSVPNLRLLYDDVSFTVHNPNNGIFSLEGVTFRSQTGEWDAALWGISIYNSLPANNCLRLRDAEAGQRQPPRICGNLYGLQLVGRTALFWLNTASFDILKGGTTIATCDATAGECLVYVP